MKWLIKNMVLVASLINLAGCAHVYGEHGWIKDHQTDYQQQDQSVAQVQLPADLSADNIENYYPIPEIMNKQPVSTPSLIPPGSQFSQYVSKPKPIAQSPTSKVTNT